MHTLHYTYNTSLYATFVKKRNIKYNKILTIYISISPFCFIVDIITEQTQYCMYSLVTLNAKMPSFGMDACMETFSILIKFITYEAVTFPGNSSSVDLRHGCLSVLMCRWHV